MRADAVRNRAKIVEAARAAFAERGLETQMEDVAKRAEVGVGTVYRHFPTKDALVRALIVDKFERLSEVAQAALERTGDPWEAFAGVLREGAERQSHDRALSQILASQPRAAIESAVAATGLDEAMEELIARAQRAGAIRGDIRRDDVPLVMCGLAAVMESDRNWERYLQLMLDGFRACDAGPLPG